MLQRRLPLLQIRSIPLQPLQLHLPRLPQLALLRLDQLVPASIPLLNLPDRLEDLLFPVLFERVLLVRHVVDALVDQADSVEARGFVAV